MNEIKWNKSEDEYWQSNRKICADLFGFPIDELYDKILNKALEEGALSDEEWYFVEGIVKGKLKNGEPLSGAEIGVLLDCGNCEVDHTYEELVNHGWVRVALIFSIDGQNYYKCTAYYHDDYGYDWIDREDQVCPQVILKKVLVKQWVEVKS